MISSRDKCLVPRNRHSSSNSLDSNWRPRSDVIARGTPKRDIHVESRADATVDASMSASGMASGHREKRSMHVRQYLKPCEDCITIMSTCIYSKRPAKFSYAPTGTDTCLVTLHRWHWMYCRAHSRQSLLIDSQTKRVVTRFCVARIPGWESPWRELNMLLRSGLGTYGLIVLPDTSQYISTPWSGKLIFLTRSAQVLDFVIPRSLVSFSCAAARI
jgi:hypothetical protein